MNVCIDVQDVSFTYEDAPEPALHHVSLQVHEGEFLAVLGHNGSGKSTLAKLLNALYLPTEGHITVCGMDTQSDENLWKIRQKAGMIFQNPDNQLVATVVREDVAFGLENLGVPREEMIPRIDAALQAVGMSQFAEAAPHMLSGGQKQRIAIAGAVAMEPECIVFDEPTAMLDPRGRKEVLSVIKRLNAKGITVLLITHFMEEAAQADRIIVMDSGVKKMEGTPDEIFRDAAKLKALSLDVPPAVDLALRLREKNIDIPEGILTIDDMVAYVCR